MPGGIFRFPYDMYGFVCARFPVALAARGPVLPSVALHGPLLRKAFPYRLHVSILSLWRRQVYDDGGSMTAARVWWSLLLYGHPRPYILAGGWDAWRAGGGGSELYEPCPLKVRWAGAGVRGGIGWRVP